MSSPIEIVSYVFLIKRGEGGVTKVGVIVNQMATEASAVSLDNEQTFLTPQNGNTTIGSPKLFRNIFLAPDPFPLIFMFISFARALIVPPSCGRARVCRCKTCTFWTSAGRQAHPTYLTLRSYGMMGEGWTNLSFRLIYVDMATG